LFGSRKALPLFGRLHGQQASASQTEAKRKSPEKTPPEETTMDELQEKHVEIDERWLSEWFEFGFSELGSYLAKHAAFDDYCQRHDNFG
jgi:hypothetical protein